ncbi:MAG: hypothetical protein ACTFAL_02810 [Candidatus Electronema sp. V4]|uniref:hypothetical protein n=1 Tax=Candidatus Electronema sp. V4 TaxID=3454756 RepID=UPI004055771C
MKKRRKEKIKKFLTAERKQGRMQARREAAGGRSEKVERKRGAGKLKPEVIFEN